MEEWRFSKEDPVLITLRLGFSKRAVSEIL